MTIFFDYIIVKLHVVAHVADMYCIEHDEALAIIYIQVQLVLLIAFYDLFCTFNFWQLLKD